MSTHEQALRLERDADAEYLRSVARNLTYNDSKGEAVRKHRLNEIALRLSTGGYDASIAAPAPEAAQSLATSDPVEADTSNVICPNCCRQFRAIPEDVQRLMLDAGFEPPFTAAPPVAADRIGALEAEVERTDAVLHEIKSWSVAYPLPMFPEPDFALAHEVLSAAGVSLDAISASNMRHVITRVQALVDAAARLEGPT